MRHPDYQAMIEAARKRAHLWRIALGLLLSAFVYAGTVALLAVALFAAVGPLEFFGWLQRLRLPAEPVPTLMVLATFAGMLVGPLIAVAACHFRPAGSLFGPGRAFLRDFARTLAAAAPLYLALFAAGWLIEAPVPNLASDVWLRWLPWAVPLLLLQVTAEEVLFRGYLQSRLAARFAARWVAFLVPSAMFAALHWNPDAGALVWLILATVFVFALIAADLTERTGNLGAAVGLHFVNNAFGLLVIAVSGTVTGLSLYTTPYTLAEPGPLALALVGNILFLGAVRLLLGRVLAR